MTRTQSIRVPLSANQVFKSNYGRYLRWALLAALVLTALFFWLMPRYEPLPYVLRDDFIEIIDVEVIQEVEVLTRPVAAPPVVKNIDPVNDLEETPVEFAETTTWDPFLPPVAGGGCFEEAPFHASSANPNLLFQAKPAYPQIARMSGIEGTVIVKVLVGPQGKILAAQVVQGVHPLLDKSALHAAFRCKFEPGTQRQMPVKAWVAVPYRFRLH